MNAIHTTSHDGVATASRVRRRGTTLVEMMLGLAMGAVLLTAVGASLSGMLNSLRTNQAQIQAMRSGRTAVEYIAAQLRQADSCTIVTQGTGSTGDPLYTTPAAEISIGFQGTDRAGVASADRLWLHVTTSLDNSRNGLRIWKDTNQGGAYSWKGQQYSNANYFDVPNVSSASISCYQVNGVVVSVMVQVTVQVTDQNGQTVSVPITATASLRRVIGV